MDAPATITVDEVEALPHSTVEEVEALPHNPQEEGDGGERQYSVQEPDEQSTVMALVTAPRFEGRVLRSAEGTLVAPQQQQWEPGQFRPFSEDALRGLDGCKIDLPPTTGVAGDIHLLNPRDHVVFGHNKYTPTELGLHLPEVQKYNVPGGRTVTSVWNEYKEEIESKLDKYFSVSLKDDKKIKGCSIDSKKKKAQLPPEWEVEFKELWLAREAKRWDGKGVITPKLAVAFIASKQNPELKVNWYADIKIRRAELRSRNQLPNFETVVDAGVALHYATGFQQSALQWALATDKIHGLEADNREVNSRLDEARKVIRGQNEQMETLRAQSVQLDKEKEKVENHLQSIAEKQAQLDAEKAVAEQRLKEIAALQQEQNRLVEKHDREVAELKAAAEEKDRHLQLALETTAENQKKLKEAQTMKDSEVRAAMAAMETMKRNIEEAKRGIEEAKKERAAAKQEAEMERGKLQLAEELVSTMQVRSHYVDQTIKRKRKLEEWYWEKEEEAAEMEEQMVALQAKCNQLQREAREATENCEEAERECEVAKRNLADAERNRIEAERQLTARLEDEAQARKSEDVAWQLDDQEFLEEEEMQRREKEDRLLAIRLQEQELRMQEEARRMQAEANANRGRGRGRGTAAGHRA